MARWFRASTLAADETNEVYLNIDLVPVMTVVASETNPGTWAIQCERDNDTAYYWLIGAYSTQAKAQAVLETILSPVDLTAITT